MVAGAVHASFTDLGLFAERFDLDIGATLPAARALDIVRTGVRAFADLHLRDLRQPFFEDPMACYPELDVIASA